MKQKYRYVVTSHILTDRMCFETFGKSTDICVAMETMSQNKTVNLFMRFFYNG